MTDTCTLVVIKGYDVTVKHNMPRHADMEHGYPWVYVDEHNIRYCLVWQSDNKTVFVVESK